MKTNTLLLIFIVHIGQNVQTIFVRSFGKLTKLCCATRSLIHMLKFNSNLVYKCQNPDCKGDTFKV